MSTKISSTFVASWEKIKAAKILSSVITVLTLYLIATFLISVLKLNSSPDQIFLSDPIKPEIIELDSENLNKLSKETENIKSVLVFTNDHKAIYFVPNAKNYTMDSNQTKAGEMLLQYASGSNLAFATNCNLIKEKHGTCHGPGWDGGIYYAERICECVPRK